MDKSYKYLGYFFLFLIPLTIAGFYKTYIATFPNFKEDITPFIHIHAFIASLWIGLLIVQPFLIVKNKLALHRKLGKASYFIFPLLILSFVPQILRTAHSANPKNLFFSLADSCLLILFYCLAIYYKKISSKHMRYMIAAALVFFGANSWANWANFNRLESIGYTKCTQSSILYSSVLYIMTNQTVKNINHIYLLFAFLSFTK